MSETLKDVRVIDFGRFIAGPFCAALLGDLGADVIRVERIKGGEDRRIIPVGSDATGAMYLQSNRNKRGMTLNPRSDAGREIVHKLVAGADVVVANLPPKALLALGLDYETLRNIKSDIILTTVNAFGPGPLQDNLGFDGLAQAMSGNLHLSGDAAQPSRAFATYVDFITASFCALSTLTAIMHKQNTGEGQLVQGSLLNSALTLMNPAIIEQQLGKPDRQALKNRHPYSGPSDVFATKDGWVMCMALGDYQFKRWCDMVGRLDLLDDERFNSDQNRGDNGAALSEIMSVWCAKRSTEDALKIMAAASVPAGPVYSPQQVLDDPNIQQLGLFNALDYPTLDQSAEVAGFPVALSASPGTIRRRAPTLGEHTDEILQSLGYDDNQISALHANGVV